MRALLVRIALLITLALVILIPLSIALERMLRERLVDARLADMQASLSSEMSIARGKIELAESRVSRLAQLISDADAKVDSRDAADLERDTHRDSSGTIRQDNAPSATYEATIWVPSTARLDSHQKALLAPEGGPRTRRRSSREADQS